ERRLGGVRLVDVADAAEVDPRRLDAERAQRRDAVGHDAFAAGLVDRRPLPFEHERRDAVLLRRQRRRQPRRPAADDEQRVPRRRQPCSAVLLPRSPFTVSSSPASQRRSASARRSLPDEVRGSAPGATTATRPASTPTAARTASRQARLNAATPSTTSPRARSTSSSSSSSAARSGSQPTA